MSRFFDRTNSEGLMYSGTPVSSFPFTVYLRYRATGLTTPHYLFQLFAGSTARMTIYCDHLNFSGSILTFISNGGTASAITTNTISDSEWHSVIGVFASTTDRRSYLDGDTANKGSSTANRNWPSPTQAEVGYGTISVPVAYAEGDIAELTIWDVAFTDAEAATLGGGDMSPLFMRPGDIVSYLPLVEGDNEWDWIGGVNWDDFSGNAPSDAEHCPVAKPSGRPRKAYYTAPSGLCLPLLYSSMH